jgi:hypothetical protein
MIMHECGVERVSMSVELYIYNEGSEGEREQEKECLSVATCDVQNKKQNCSDPFEPMTPTRSCQWIGLRTPSLQIDPPWGIVIGWLLLQF